MSLWLSPLTMVRCAANHAGCSATEADKINSRAFSPQLLAILTTNPRQPLQLQTPIFSAPFGARLILPDVEQCTLPFPDINIR